MTNARRKLPRSFKVAGVAKLDHGGTSRISTSTTRAIDKAATPWPEASSTPYELENQCGSSDIAQSIAANVTLSPQMISPGPLMSANLRRRAGTSAVTPAESVFKQSASSVQTTK